MVIHSVPCTVTATLLFLAVRVCALCNQTGCGWQAFRKICQSVLDAACTWEPSAQAAHSPIIVKLQVRLSRLHHEGCRTTEGCHQSSGPSHDLGRAMIWAEP